MYNNCMSAFDPRPGRRNSIAPGKARSTAVAETILLQGGKTRLVLGSPGAARITAALVQAILNIVHFGMTASEAVLHPRFDAYGDRKLVLESRFPQPLVKALRARGWDILQSHKPFGIVGRVYAIEMDPEGRRPPIAGVDPGEPGAAYRT
jgi:gamma-glutamyltranspeptidase/glutathione hydrolase